ncbi:hypothetical protein V6N12_074241 [Hibiscus sabdariffa]|uniref:Uncharacterized protein n=1 Tax=Hibiscus sabdariffa TaxID=183260 RepID=A0ABR2BG85_9ROSI
MSALMVYVERGLLGRINSAQLLGLVENRFSLVLEACLKYLDAVLNNNIFRESKRIRIIEVGKDHSLAPKRRRWR